MATDFQSGSYTDVPDVRAESARPGTSCSLIGYNDNTNNDNEDGIAWTTRRCQLSRVIDVARVPASFLCLRQFRFLHSLFSLSQNQRRRQRALVLRRGWRWRAAAAVLKTGEWHSATAGRKGAASSRADQSQRSLSLTTDNRRHSKY